VYNWLTDFFHGHCHSTVFRDQWSSFLNITASIVQGLVIGPAACVVTAGDLAAATAGNISVIMNSSINSGLFPQLWKNANVTAVWKNKGSRTVPANYRPISILPVLARTMEKEIARQLSMYCICKEIIPQQQFGFRANSSCEIALLHALDGWMRAIDKGDMVGALLVDLSKVFDTVPHQKLIMELADIGCGMLSLAWFANYLSDRFQRVVQPPIYTE